ncbi:hypothetical protein SCP_0105860 [Sparassis crispa]|uniref:F-box domain-containing protein n=1 Tax=Sparassis crispa TaxID=139825 RepID=A0A401G6C8_9APHY|nr:hypothetical protein SCP_0105860 [Sparassis crispa]GBE77704.1 hypothetical protein SCP_0105860 [Sparassis crispa]
MLTFPHLRVLSLHHEVSSPEDVYGFIHRHSSLLEVNVSFSSFRHFLSLESLMLLVEGTGIWTHQFTLGDEHERDMSQGSSNIGFKSFAFTRMPLASDPTHSSQGPLYELTRLALPVKIQAAFWSSDEWVSDVPQFLATADVFRAVEELRLSYENIQLYKKFTDFMREIGERLKG